MMSRNSSLVNTVSVKGMQRELFSRRIWAAVISWLFFLLYYPAGVIMLITGVQARSQYYQYTARQARYAAMSEVSQWIGLEQTGVWGVVVLAVIIALEGYAYLNNRRKLDFYESQPVPRNTRFWAVYVNGLLLYIVPYLCSLVLSIAVAAGMHAMNVPIAVNGLYAFVRVSFLFLAVYSTAILAVMLTGNLVVAGGITIIFLGLEAMLRSVLYHYAVMLLRTFYSDGMKGTFFSCIGAYSQFLNTDIWREGMITTEESFRIYGIYNIQIPSMQFLGKVFVQGWTYDLRLLILWAATTAIAFICYRKRRTESAGQALAFQVIRFPLKLAVGIPAALFIGKLLTDMYNVSRESAATAITILGIALTAVILGCALEILYDFNIRSVFRRFWQAALAGAAAVLIFSIYRFDLTGYDLYVPDADKVESAALIGEDANRGYVDSNLEYLYDSNAFLNSRMKLTDIGAVEEIALAGQRNRVENDGQSYQYGSGDAKGWEATVFYHMKDGSTIARSITIPYDMKEQTMNAVVGSKEYKEAIYEVYDSFEEDSMKKLAENGYIGYDCGYGTKRTDGSSFEAFARAYAKDLEKYDFTLASTKEPVGVVYVGLQEEQSSYSYMLNYEVYDTYTNTIAFLKEQGIYQESVPTAEQVAKLSVEYYGPGPEDGQSDIDEIDPGMNVDYTYTESSNAGSTRKTYTDKKEMEEILQHVVSASRSAYWKKGQSSEDYYSITLTLEDDAGADSQGYENIWYYNFRAGEVPSFVNRDLGVN